MIDKLYDAVKRMIDNPDFVPYSEGKYSTGRQFELYINKLIVENLGSDLYTRNSIKGYGKRRFDIKINVGNKWNVCEIGHQKSSNGYLHNVPGLVNKLIFDYIKNYQYDELNITSFAILYFTLESGYNENSTEEMLKFIENLFPKDYCVRLIVTKNNVPKGKVLLINGLKSLKDVRKLYYKNSNLLSYIKDFENSNGKKWPKHQILKGEVNPWDNF